MNNTESINLNVLLLDPSEEESNKRNEESPLEKIVIKWLMHTMWGVLNSTKELTNRIDNSFTIQLVANFADNLERIARVDHGRIKLHIKTIEGVTEYAVCAQSSISIPS